MQNEATTLSDKLAIAGDPSRILLNRAETAEYLGLTIKALHSYSASKYSDLKYSKIGNKAMYRLSDVMAYVESKQKQANY